MKGRGRVTSIAAMPTRAVKSPLTTPSPRRAESLRGDAVAEDLLDQRVARRHAAGDGEMGDGGARQTKEADGAGPAAIERREPADQAQDFSADEEKIDHARAARSR